MPSPSAEAAEDLYDKIAGTTPKKLQRGVKHVEKLSAEDVEALDRGGLHWLRTTSRQVKIAFMWVSFVFAVVVGAAAIVLLGVLMWSFAADTIKNNKSGVILSATLQFLAGVAVTLAVERFAKSKD